jgi:ribosomal protein L40E
MKKWEIAALCFTFILFGIGVYINNNTILMFGGLSCFITTPILIRRYFFVKICPYCGSDVPKTMKQCGKCLGYLV